ncbi:ATP-binding protein [Myxococcus sp. SDU36]|nr:ATP-binding protein [Myxococcus sp. SDU36]
MENFKGFSERLDLNLDAEIVLLVGPNGRGKTSTIEALELAVTETIGRRIGGKEEFDLRDFIHCNRKSGTTTGEARIRATWSDGSGTDEIVINQTSRGSIASFGPWAALRANELATQSELDLVRACTFLYSDSLGSLAGLDLDSRRKVIDFFVPNFPELDALAEIEAPTLSAAISGHISRIKSSLPDTQILNSQESHCAMAAQKAWQPLAAPKIVKFVKANRELADHGNIKIALRKVCSHLGIEQTIDDDYQKTLNRIHAAAVARISEPSEAPAQIASASPEATKWIGVQSALQALERSLGQSNDFFALSLKALEVKKTQIGTAENLRERLSSKEREQTSIARRISTIWQPGQELRLPDGSWHMATGTIPILASLAKLAGDTDLPSYWETSGLPKPNQDLFNSLLLLESNRLKTLQAEHASISNELADISHNIATLSSIENIAELIQGVDKCWAETGSADHAPRTSDGAINVSEIRKEIAVALAHTEKVLTPPQEENQWVAIADAFSEWAKIRAKVNHATQQTAKQQHLEDARIRLDQAQKIIEHIESNKRGCFRDVFRTNIVEQRYEIDLNKSMKQILRWYAHRRDVIEHARIEFHRHGPLQIRIGPKEGRSTGIASLSRSQLTSLAFGLAIAANLGQPKLPTEFLCLDDVSDAFDLDNLAADAAMLRLLAYGETGTGKYGRRQLILTNHNDHLTNRIVPLLRPPAGRRMRVIEFIDKGNDSSIQVKQWEVLGERQTRWEGRSPLRALLPPTGLGAGGQSAHRPKAQ